MGIYKGTQLISGSSGGGGGIDNADNITIITQQDGSISTNAVLDQNSTESAVKTWTGTLEEYNAMKSHDADTLYYITNDDQLSDNKANVDLSNLSEQGQGILNAITDRIQALESQEGESGITEIPIASTEVLGGVKVDGNTISITGDGVISAVIPEVDEYILPTASTDILGGVKVDGETITIENGIISAMSSGGGSGVPTVVETGSNSSCSWTQYSDGWIDIHGVIAKINEDQATVVLTLPKPINGLRPYSMRTMCYYYFPPYTYNISGFGSSTTPEVSTNDYLITNSRNNFLESGVSVSITSYSITSPTKKTLLNSVTSGTSYTFQSGTRGSNTFYENVNWYVSGFLA